MLICSKSATENFSHKTEMLGKGILFLDFQAVVGIPKMIADLILHSPRHIWASENEKN